MRSVSLRFSSRGFTLIELLVVISVIALLMSILLSVLNRAKEAARTVRCEAHLRQVGISLIAYSSEWNDAFAGPCTSGTKLSSAIYGDSIDTPNEYKNSITGSTAPSQNLDWVSPMMGASLALPEDPIQRQYEIFNNELRCPSNRDYYDREYMGSDKARLRYFSYAAAMGFHVVRDQQDSQSQAGLITDKRVSDRVTIPQGYFPNINKIGRPVEKIFAMEGNRYINPDTLEITYNKFLKQVVGGNFMVYGPSVVEKGDPFYGMSQDSQLKLQEKQTRFAYRHNKKMNVVFFDGHTESLEMEESVKTAFYFPRGSQILNAGKTQDTHDSEGSVP